MLIESVNNRASSCFKLTQIRPTAQISWRCDFWWLHKTWTDIQTDKIQDSVLFYQTQTYLFHGRSRFKLVHRETDQHYDIDDVYFSLVSYLSIVCCFDFLIYFDASQCFVLNFDCCLFIFYCMYILFTVFVFWCISMTRMVDEASCVQICTS